MITEEGLEWLRNSDNPSIRYRFIGERVEKLQEDVRWDDGYLCRRRSFTDSTKSCLRGTVSH